MSKRAVTTDEANTRSVATTAGPMPCMASFAATRLWVRAQGSLLPWPDAMHGFIRRNPPEGSRAGLKANRDSACFFKRIRAAFPIMCEYQKKPASRRVFFWKIAKRRALI
jgi:hypothetical protein